ncbi:MAG: Smr/MutS family protein [Bacteroidales bacterium]|nr:Smr/MutS family protein [Candidatus Cryptobacteroides choladohippi]
MNRGTDTRLEGKLGFDRVRTMISDRCMTDYAARRVAEEEFSSDPATIRKRLALTDEMRLILMFEENFPTTGYIDALPFLEPLLKEGSCIDALSLAKLKTAIDTIRRIIVFFGGIKDGIYPQLKRLASPVHHYPEVLRRIEQILDKYGEIKDSASEKLFEIRRDIRAKEASVSKRAAAILRQAQDEGIVEADASVNIRDGKYLIPVGTSSKRKIQGFVYGESASGKTTFVEPAEIVELENDILELRFAESREINRILLEFTGFVRPYVPELMEGAGFLGEIDFLMAKAGTALDFIAGMPVVSEDGTLALRKARHPLLEKALHREGKEMVPLTVSLDPRKHILLISGPNAGGKSVCLKTLGLLQYMFQWGMLIPTSESSELPVFDRIMVSIGDDQSIDNDLSTYSSFLADMRDMLACADSRTLVLIDEFGSGTEPAAGGAIAEAILSELDRRGVYGLITTHYTNLKRYASGAETGVINGAMLYDSSRIEPMFKLEVGLPGNSFAFELARKMRLPEAIVKDAEARAGEEFVGIERNLRRIARGRRQLDEKLQKVKKTDRNLEALTEQYQQELEEIKARKKQILDDARKEAQDIVKGAGAQVEKTIRDIKEAQAGKEETKAARLELQGFLGAIEKKKEKDRKTRDEYIDRKISQLEKRRRKKDTPSPDAKPDTRQLPLKVGEKVRMKDNGMVGEVSKVSSKAVTVIIGNISSSMAPERLERISSNEFKESTRKQFKPVQQKMDASISERKLQFKPEIDIRGARLSDALDAVTRYIDDAIMLNIGMVRIIHGKGTGVLREEIQKYLRTVPGLTVKDEDIRQGGTGVTIVTFD